MKLTKKQLKRIIKEEKAKLQESFHSRPNVNLTWSAEDEKESARRRGVHDSSEISKQLAIIHNAVDVLTEVMEPDELALELEGIAEDLRGMYG